MSVCELKIGGSALMLRPNETSAEEISKLLTARFGGSDSMSKAVALQDASSTLIFPLDVVAARPEVLRSVDRLVVMFSFTATTSLLRRLFLKGSLAERDVALLYTLGEDPFLLAALEVYREEGDEVDLVDTLRRIVAIRAHAPPSSASPNHKRVKQALSPSNNGNNNDSVLELSKELLLEEFPSSELGEIFAQLKAQRKLSADDHAVLVQLAHKELPHLQAAYEVFVIDEEDEELLDTLLRVVKTFGLERLVDNKPFGRMVLDAFAQGNAAVCGAWDVFVDERNEEDFVDTLSRIAPRLATNGKREQEAPAPSAEKQALRKMVLYLYGEGKISEEQGQELMQIVNYGSPEGEVAMRAYNDAVKKTPEVEQELLDAVLGLLDEFDPNTAFSSDDDDEALRSSLSEFLNHLVKEARLSSEENESLQALVTKRDSRVLAMFDLFQEELDLDDLVDSLKHLASASQVELLPVDYNMESLFATIMGLGGLSPEQLETIREAMELGNPDIEEAIYSFVETEQEDVFRTNLIKFCRFTVDHTFDLESVFEIVSSLGLSEEDVLLLREAMEARNVDVEMAVYDFVDNEDTEKFKAALQLFLQDQVFDTEYDFASLFAVVSALGLSDEHLLLVKDAMEIRHPDVEEMIYTFVQEEDKQVLKEGLEAWCASQQ